MSDARLKSLAERIERLMDERDGIQGDIRDIYTEAKSAGYVPKVLRKAITRKRMDVSKRDEEDAILELYEGALSGPMRRAVQMAASGKTSREIEKETGIDHATVSRSVALNKKSATKPETADLDTPPGGDTGTAVTSSPGPVAADPSCGQPDLASEAGARVETVASPGPQDPIEAGADAPAAGSGVVLHPPSTPRPAGEAEIAGGSNRERKHDASTDRGRGDAGLAEDEPVGAVPAADEGSAADAESRFTAAVAATWTAPDPIRVERKLEPDDDLEFPPHLKRAKPAVPETA